MKKGVNMKKIFVSGTYDILHAGHIQFFKEARALGDYLIVSCCSNKNLLLYKGRRGSMPEDNKKILLESVRYIDKVIIGSDDGGIWDFVPAFLKEKPDMLVVTEDDKHTADKKKFCQEHGVEFIILPKTPPAATSISTTEIIKNIKGVI
jgi:cytidyltransferase-like protein